MRSVIELLDFKMEQELNRKIVEEIEGFSLEDWFWVDFQRCYMLPIYNARALKGDMRGWLKNKILNPKLGKNSPLVEFLREKLFPYIEGEGNVTILRTPSKYKLRTHIDAAPEEVKMEKLKFRLVLKGDLNSLYFVDNEGGKKFFDIKHSAYLVNGAHPHGVQNFGETEKLTLCVGSPWEARKNFVRRLEGESVRVHKVALPEVIDKSWLDLSRYSVKE